MDCHWISADVFSTLASRIAKTVRGLRDIPGSAIKGPVRGDVFWGFGETAARRAGLMKQRGRYYILLPKSAERIVPES